ncbi:phage tail sheath subtilisin-like domain-containing protein [Marine Group I thaumarchaeote]|uniref:Phage tail sheath subtilisin-like domain-containing protein n=1 Tax=Marine Group I thaumarchaeote TaxID=2511932 RepID=A0A7K4MPT7_9ARCH|nr:phage tail sheath subtilisin-like domain-containing protein [Marine Group I thaumarchaeote]
MPFQVSPGINVSEIDLTLVVPNVATSIGAMAGSFQWGPVLERTSITTEKDLVTVFGEPNDDTQEYFHTCSNYLAYSNNLLVVRNIGTDAKNAVVGDSDAGTVANVNNADDYDTDTFTDQLFVAKYPGELGNSLKVQVIDSNGWADATVNATFKANFDRAPGTSNDVANANGWDGVEANRPVRSDEMHVIVIDEDGLWTGEPGQVLEKFAFVSKASDAKKIDGSSNYIKTVLRNESRYVWLGQVTRLTNGSSGSGRAAGQGKVGTAFLTFNNSTAALSIPGGSLTGGVDDNILSDGELQTGYALYIIPEVVDVTLVMAGPASTTTARYIVDTITSVRKDCIALVSPAKASVVNAGTAQVANLTTDNTALGSSSYAVMDGAWKYQYDRYNDVFRFVPMNGDIAGLCARTDFTNDAWWSPAGLNRGTVKNIVKLSWEATKADRDTLYQLGVNSIITQRGAGVVLWGDKTMQTVPSAFDRINVRRLFIVLEKAISIAAKAMLFEFNDEFTRSQFVNLVEPFLREVQGRRGITDFKVVCDSSNNTGQVIDTNNFIGDIYIKPARSINFIQLNFIATRTDVSFSEIGG